MKQYGSLIVRGALVLMEALWVYALVVFLIAITVGGDRPTFIGVLAVVGLSFAISRGLQNSELSLGILRFWGVLLSFLLFYVVMRIDFFGDLRLWDFSFADDLFNNTEASLRDEATAVIAIPVLWAVWIRGILRGQQSITFDDVVRSFALGIIVVGFVALFAGIVDDMPREADFVAIPYVAVGLLAIGLAHTARAADQFERQFTNVWFVVAGGAVLVMGLFALLFVVIDFDTARSALATAGRGVGYVVAGIFYVVLLPVLWIIEQMFIAMRWIQDLWGGEPFPPIEDEVGEIGPDPNREPGDSPMPDWVGTAVRILVGGGLIAAAIAGTALLFSRFQRLKRPDGVRESTYQEGRLGADLGDLWGNVLGRFRRQGSQADAQAEPVRRLYFELLEAAAERGVERRPMETPLEMAPRFDRVFSSQTPSEITALFDEVRYGGAPASEAELKRLREAWERLPRA